MSLRNLESLTTGTARHTGRTPQRGIPAVPKGQHENSPAFQRRELSPEILSPEGTVDSGSSATLFQPSLRDLFGGCPFPGVKTPGYSRKVPPGLPCAPHSALRAPHSEFPCAPYSSFAIRNSQFV
jgi:hypothetical protein